MLNRAEYERASTPEVGKVFNKRPVMLFADLLEISSAL